LLHNTSAIIFDLGGVLIDVDYNKTINAFEKLGIEDARELYSQRSQSTLFNEIECGEISSEDFLMELSRRAKKELSLLEIKEAWNAIIGPYNKRIIPLLQSLKKDYKLFVLSNTNSIHIEKANDEWSKISSISMSSFFDKVYLSHEIGDRKPNTSVFKNLCEEQNLNPGKTLFIDDSIQHIESAKRMGLKTHHLKSMESLYELFS
tara:strand:+ start:1074 stop:1688 length:615 start_codon:yes stop_codon:yes gene_type:complete